MQAYGWLASDPGRAAQEAQAALKVSPICPEAYNVLALAQPILNLDKASELYRTGEECALQARPLPLRCRCAVPAAALAAAAGRRGALLEVPGGVVMLALRARGPAPELLPPPLPSPAQVLPPEGVDEELAGGDLWSRFCLRPWLRASLGVGNSLRKLGRYAEALEQCERLAQRLEWKMKSGPAVGSFVTL